MLKWGIIGRRLASMASKHYVARFEPVSPCISTITVSRPCVLTTRLQFWASTNFFIIILIDKLFLHSCTVWDFHKVQCWSIIFDSPQTLIALDMSTGPLRHPQRSSNYLKQRKLYYSSSIWLSPVAISRIVIGLGMSFTLSSCKSIRSSELQLFLPPSWCWAWQWSVLAHANQEYIAVLCCVTWLPLCHPSSLHLVTLSETLVSNCRVINGRKSSFTQGHLIISGEYKEKSHQDE